MNVCLAKANSDLNGICSNQDPLIASTSYLISSAGGVHDKHNSFSSLASQYGKLQSANTVIETPIMKNTVEAINKDLAFHFLNK